MDFLLSFVGTIVSIAIGAWILVSESRDIGVCYLLPPIRSEKEKQENVKNFFKMFAFLLLIYGIAVCIQYKDKILNLRDSLFLALGLLLVMIGGMVVQVISNNYRNGREMLDVTMSQLIYPLLFSVIVFYPIWVVASAQDNIPFAIYTAFLNGYFWESIVSETRPPEPIIANTSGSNSPRRSD